MLGIVLVFLRLIFFLQWTNVTFWPLGYSEVLGTKAEAESILLIGLLVALERPQ